MPGLSNESSDVWPKIDSASSKQWRISNTIEAIIKFLMSFWQIKQDMYFETILCFMHNLLCEIREVCVLCVELLHVH